MGNGCIVLVPHHQPSPQIADLLCSLSLPSPISASIPRRRPKPTKSDAPVTTEISSDSRELAYSRRLAEIPPPSTVPTIPSPSLPASSTPTRPDPSRRLRPGQTRLQPSRSRRRLLCFSFLLALLPRTAPSPSSRQPSHQPEPECLQSISDHLSASTCCRVSPPIFPSLLAMASSLLSNCCSSSSCLSRLHPLRSSTTLVRFSHRQGFLPFPLKALSSPIHLFASDSRSWSSCAVSPVAMSADVSAKVIDGKSVANEIREEVAAEVSRLKDAFGIVPGLAVILVGSRKDSQTYVRNKKKACEAAGIKSYEVNLPEDCTEEEVLEHIRRLNNDPSVHGILVQLPLPPLMDVKKVQNSVSVEKDVDGFHLINIGLLTSQGDPLFVPCTPKGCMELLHRYGVEIKGKRAVVIGRSDIVGKPAASLLQGENATVTVVHSRTSNPEEIVRQADILISACGIAKLVKGSWIKPGAVVIDVGINPIDDAESPRGYRIVGDVCYEEACKVASAITPVPGGVGPMTIAMLLSNTLIAAKRIHNIK